VLAGGAYGRLVPPADSGAIADAIAEAMTHCTEWRQRAEAARQYVEATFAPAAGIQRLQELLVSVARCPQ
jgi:glycosyltransferase involved in cell wall biosynthesis